jgi:hypothetical protein
MQNITKSQQRSGPGLSSTDLFALVDSHMRLHYRKGLDEMEISDVPGYWRDREPQMHTGHPLHGCLGCSGPFRATYTYYDPPRRDGRFASRTRTWAILANAEVRHGAKDADLD